MLSLIKSLLQQLLFIYYSSPEIQKDWRHWIGIQSAPISLCLMAEGLQVYLNKCLVGGVIHTHAHTAHTLNLRD